MRCDKCNEYVPPDKPVVVHHYSVYCIRCYFGTGRIPERRQAPAIL
jgi:formylmethanofuran dehydrogenase subunit E